MASTSSVPTPATLIAALLAVADAENAAVYGYPVAGARLSVARDEAMARADYDVHRAQLQAVIGWLADRGATPPAPAAVYQLPHRVIDDASATAVLVLLEEGAAARYADLVPLATGSLRRAAALALQSAAVREAKWRRHSVPFPGLVGRLPG